MSVKRYIKKPIPVQAMQYNGDNWREIEEWADAVHWRSSTSMAIKTLEGTMIANVGDWIIRGVAGEFYPCKNEIFRATYEEEPEYGHP